MAKDLGVDLSLDKYFLYFPCKETERITCDCEHLIEYGVDDIITQYKPNDYSPDNYFLYIRCPHCDRIILIKRNDKSRLQYWYIKNKIINKK